MRPRGSKDLFFRDHAVRQGKNAISRKGKQIYFCFGVDQRWASLLDFGQILATFWTNSHRFKLVWAILH